MSVDTRLCFVKYIICVVSLILLLLLCFYYFLSPRFLNFSDAAKFADIARNIIEGKGSGTNFAFFGANWQELTAAGIFPTKTLPVYPAAITLFFKIFGKSDISVIATSSFFYFLLVVVTYFIGKKLWGKLVGALAGLAVAANVNLLDYATSGASEPLFIFEILLVIYLLILKRKWASWIGVLTLMLMYFTRPQAFIYIAGLILFWLLINFKTKKVIKYFVGIVLLAVVFDYTALSGLASNSIFYSILRRGDFAVSTPLGESASQALREAGNASGIFSLTLIKKVFYNLYNFYKLLPQIASPYMWGLFVIGLFHWSKNKAENSLKAATIFMVIVTFLVAALTIPFFRYLHPVVPLVYLFATATLVWIVRSMVKKWPFVKKLSKEKFIILTSSFLILLFVVGQTLGVIFLDSRFEAQRTNRGKPPVYVVLSQILKENTNPEDLVITNLDTWGSWYGERKTVWFPLRPNQLDVGGEESPFDAIYLTSYLIDDENYYMGDEWRQILENPENPENAFISENYKLKDSYQVSAEENYEKQAARAVLLIKKED